MVAAACLTLGSINLGIAFGQTQRAPHFFFFLNALAVAAIAALELGVLQADNLERYQTLLRWAQLPLWLMVVSFVGFVWVFFGTARKSLGLAAIGLNTIALIANFAAPAPAIREAVAIWHEETFGGATFTLPKFVNGPWNLVALASIATLLAFVVDASIALWRKGKRRRAAVVGGAIVFFLVASRVYGSLVEAGVVRTPYFFALLTSVF